MHAHIAGRKPDSRRGLHFCWNPIPMGDGDHCVPRNMRIRRKTWLHRRCWGEYLENESPWVQKCTLRRRSDYRAGEIFTKNHLNYGNNNFSWCRNDIFRLTSNRTHPFMPFEWTSTKKTHAYAGAEEKSLHSRASIDRSVNFLGQFLPSDGKYERDAWSIGQRRQCLLHLEWCEAEIGKRIEDFYDCRDDQ